MKTALKIIVGFVIVGLVGALIYLRTPETRHASQADIRDAAQTYDARIIRDEWGVAHVFGVTDADTSFGLGFSHAEDDWETIQGTIIDSRGENARYKGKDGGKTDYLFDLFKVEEAVAAKIGTDITPEVRAIAKAYADGVNLWAIDHPERVWANILPVTDMDIIAGFTWKTPFFYRMDEALADLFTADNKPAVSPWGREAALQGTLPEAVRGSNAFAIAPSRSEDGHTRLVVNSHQPFVGPYAWFEAHVVSEEGLNLAGAGFPGTPILTQGVTPTHGWAHTVNRPDLVDIYELTVNDPKAPTQYKIDGDWKDFERSKSKFRVKLWGPFSLPYSRDILWSDHGPVLETPNGYYAVRFAGMGEVKAMEQWYRMSRAETPEAWDEALKINGVLSFNIVWADKHGNIGEIYNAKMPNRLEGPDWQSVLPGDRSELIWEGYRPVTDMPRIENPPCGWLFSANATPFTITDPACDNQREAFSETMGIEYRVTNRAMRALELFTADDAVSREELYAYRADDRYAEGSPLRLVVGRLLDADLPDDLAEARAVLAAWDGGADIKNRSTALAVLTGMKARGYEIIEENMTETDALREAARDLTDIFGRIDPEWGEVNRLRRGDVDLPLNGGPDTLRAIYGHLETFRENKGLVAVAGDTHIMVADWDPQGNLVLDSIHQFGAATLDETSPHYADQAVLFAEGRYKRMPMSLAEVLPTAMRDYRPGE